jgi:hypothetical protein
MDEFFFFLHSDSDNSHFLFLFVMDDCKLSYIKKLEKTTIVTGHLVAEQEA